MPSFDPRDFPNLFVWGDPTDASKVTDAGGGAVSQIVSKDSGAKVFSQAGGSQRPTTGTRNINGQNCLDFDGGDLLTYLTNISLSANNGASTFYVVAMADTIATYRSLWTADKSTGGGDRLTQGPRSPNTTDTSFSWFDTGGGITSTIPTGMAALTSPFILTLVFSGTTAKTLDVYRDSTHVGTQGAFGGVTPRTASANWALGAVDLSDISHGWDGPIGGWLFYNEDHEATGRRATVETYLRRKFATP